MRVVDRIGEENFNKSGHKMIIVEYVNNSNISVLFPEFNYKKDKCQYFHFKKGNIKCPFEKSMYGVGYIGEGLYKSVKSDVYNRWNHLFTRCYNEKYIDKFPTYKDVTVCEEWHNFQNFAKWYEENYYEVDGEKMCLDKDILVKGNKVYSPDTCVFVPEKINNLFIKSNSSRGECPIGVSYHKTKKKYSSGFRVKNKLIHLGYFINKTEAFNEYKKAKEKYIKQVADEYKDRIPKRLYDALYRYEVEITD